jgi:hypothetical protein
MINTLPERAVTVRVRISRYRPYKFDPNATWTVREMAGVADAGRFNKRLFAGNRALNRCNRAYDRVYDYVLKNTLPWLDDGQRALPLESLRVFSGELELLIMEARQTVADLRRLWPQMVEDDLKRLGSLGRREDYPSASEMERKWNISVLYQPIATSYDFRSAVPEGAGATLDAALREAEENCSAYLLRELLEPVRKIAEKLALPAGHDRSAVTPAMLRNMDELCARVRRLNFSGDRAVDAMADELSGAVRRMRERTPKAVSEYNYEREASRRELEELTDKMASFL